MPRCIADLPSNFRPTKVASTTRVSKWFSGSGSCPPGTSRSPAHMPGVNSVAYSHDGKRLASAGTNGWSRSGTLRHGGEALDLGGKDGNHGIGLQPRWRALRIRQLRQNRGDCGTPRPDGEIRRLEGHSGHVNRVVFSPDGRAARIRRRRQDSKALERRVGTGDPYPTRATITPSIASRSAPTGNGSASASWEDAVKLWDAHDRPGNPHTQVAPPAVPNSWRSARMGESSACAGPFWVAEVVGRRNRTGVPQVRGALEQYRERRVQPGRKATRFRGSTTRR